MGKIFDTTNSPTFYDLVSQTPKNFSEDNYFLSTLQEKINSEWEYRPNRVDIEQEKTVGKGDFYPLEAVIQSVVNSKGMKISDDVRKLVFKDMQHEARLGTKFRFSYNFDLEEPNEDKKVWLSTNKDSLSPTAQAVITMCNGTLGTIEQDENGVGHYHYEPAIITSDLSIVNLYFNDTIVTPQAQIMIIVQHNEVTRQYGVNDRFIMGYDKVYKIKAINKFNSLSTFDPHDIGAFLMYADVDEISPKDDFDNRIAHNSTEEATVPEEAPKIEDFSFEIVKPKPLPTELYSTPIRFEVFLKNGEEPTATPVSVEVSLDGASNPESYYELLVIDGNTFTLRRRKLYNRSLLEVRVFVPASLSPVGQEFTQTFEMSLREME